MTSSEAVFVTGCDASQEWILPWFLENYSMHNTTPLVLFDFGMTYDASVWAKGKFTAHYSLTSSEKRDDRPTWSFKPSAISRVWAETKVWLDVDCEVLGDLSGIFDLLVPERLNMVKDRPWTTRRGETWYNSGVVGVVGEPRILDAWSYTCKNNPFQGDQEVLHQMRKFSLAAIDAVAELPNKYNWLRIQLQDGEDSPDKLVVHWTGAKGKDIIRAKINDGNTPDRQRDVRQLLQP